MAKKKTDSKDTSWRTIKQSSVGRAVTKAAKQRRLRINLRYVGLAMTGLAVLTMIGGAIWWWQNRAFGALAVPEETLRQVYFDTDGVLSESWLEESVTLPRDVALMDVDIFALREELLSYGQVRSAEVERIFPNALKVTVEERQPILRIVTMNASGKRFMYLISSEGEVFTGQNYPKATLRRLPFLDGVVLRRNGTGFQTVAQAPVVAELLETARRGWPELYADWRIVSCRDFNGNADEVGALIRIQSRRMGEIIMRPYDFPQQLTRLSEISEYTKRENLDRLSRVDLSLEDPAIRLAASDVRRGPHASR